MLYINIILLINILKKIDRIRSNFCWICCYMQKNGAFMYIFKPYISIIKQDIPKTNSFSWLKLQERAKMPLKFQIWSLLWANFFGVTPQGRLLEYKVIKVVSSCFNSIRIKCVPEGIRFLADECLEKSLLQHIFHFLITILASDVEYLWR